jgi:ADP-dependent NAD(P)H-hydrate dehydratase / NAD(P)H-hydrate epimerase
MKIFSAVQQKGLDQQTIATQQISSFELMERASRAFCESFKLRVDNSIKVDIYCGSGNNGGDGLAIARLLYQSKYNVKVFRVDTEHYTPDNQTNMEKLKALLPSAAFINNLTAFKPDSNTIAIDALFGTGLNRPLSGKNKEIVIHLNSTYGQIFSVDIPSGLYCDAANEPKDAIIKCAHCFTFNAPKLSFLLPSSGSFVPSWEVIDIGIPEALKEKFPSANYYIDKAYAKKIPTKRKKFSHKGDFGYGLLWAGSYGMYGAAVLSSRAAMKAGIGKLCVYSSVEGHQILQIANPEAMFSNENELSVQKDFNALAIGPRLGKHPDFIKNFRSLLASYGDLTWVIDADALNLISMNRELLESLPENCILTPHPKEFERLTGLKSRNSFERLEQLKAFAKKTKCIVVLKGAYTAIASSEGNVYFNSTGNPKMVTAGSGDVLTGIILALIGQKHTALKAAIYGVYLHGKAGDKAAKKKRKRNMIATNIINQL